MPDITKPVPNETAELKEWKGLAFKFIRRLIAIGVDCDVAESDMYLGLLKAIRTYDPTKAAKITWYYCVLRSAYTRTKRTYNTSNARQLHDATYGHYLRSDVREFFSNIDDRVCDLAMSVLGPVQRRIIWMRYFENISYSNIAKELDLTKSKTVAIRDRAVRAMRRVLRDRGLLNLRIAENTEGLDLELGFKEIGDEHP